MTGIREIRCGVAFVFENRLYGSGKMSVYMTNEQDCNSSFCCFAVLFAHWFISFVIGYDYSANRRILRYFFTTVLLRF